MTEAAEKTLHDKVRFTGDSEWPSSPGWHRMYFRYMKARRFSNFVVVSCTYSRHGLRAMRHEFATFDLKKRVEFGENFGFRSENLALSSSRVSNSPFGTTSGRMSQLQQENCSLRIRKTPHFLNKIPNLRGIRLFFWGPKWQIHVPIARHAWRE